jgi:hypothetical protein
VFGPVLRGTKCTLRPPRKDELSIYQRWFEDVDVLAGTQAFMENEGSKRAQEPKR